MEAFPAFFALAGRRVVVAGDSDGAEVKARLLESSPAEVIRLKGEPALDPHSYEGVTLAFIGSADPAFREAAATAAKSAGALVNVVDHPTLSDFMSPAIVDRGQVVAAIGTAGAAPIVAALIRAELEARIPASLGPLAALFGRLRAEIVATFPDLAQRRAFLRRVLDGPAAQAADAGDMAGAEEAMRAELAKGVAAVGRITLVAAAAERDLLSLKAARALAAADLLVLDGGLDPDLVALARRDAERRPLAEVTAATLAAACASGAQVAVIASAFEILNLAEALAEIGAPSEVLSPAPTA
jgi:precorrin-2 dehydrogenase/sirohydrochlorin ferrochelatase